MTRAEFLAELNLRLKNLPQEEREGAMQFYVDYFDDAGTENEQQVISQLGSPQKVAEQLIAPREIPLLPPKQRRGVWFYVMAVLASPFLVLFGAIAVMLFAALCMVVFGMVLVMATIAVVPFIVACSMLLSGGVALFVGLRLTFIDFASMLFFLGAGLAMFSLGMLIFGPSISIMRNSLKGVFRGSGWMIRKLNFFKWGRRVAK